MAMAMARFPTTPPQRANRTALSRLSKRPCRNRLETLHPKTALVTGAAKRIGRSLALSLATAGADVAITYRDSAGEAQAAVEDLKRLKVRAAAVQCDVRNPESVSAAVAGVVEQFGRLDILVNNAGTFETAVLQSIPVAQWDNMLATNTRAPF